MTTLNRQVRKFSVLQRQSRLKMTVHDVVSEAFETLQLEFGIQLVICSRE